MNVYSVTIAESGEVVKVHADSVHVLDGELRFLNNPKRVDSNVYEIQASFAHRFWARFELVTEKDQNANPLQA
jgi:hypothetical protein